MSSLVIIDNGGANIASIRYALARLGANATLSADAETIRRATRLLLPGVGAAGDAMRRLRKRGLDQLIPMLQQPLLGVCLGMQLLYQSSAEDNTPGLGIIPGRVSKLNSSTTARVPHMGWNTLNRRVSNHPLLRNIPEAAFVYFVHGYAAPVNQYSLSVTEHSQNFASMAQKDNFYATQFHPERSAQIGQQILKNFLELE